MHNKVTAKCAIKYKAIQLTCELSIDVNISNMYGLIGSIQTLYSV